MKIKLLLILGGAALLGGCVYSSQPGYTSASPYYYSYQPAYQTTYQTTYRPADQGYAYRPASYPYPLYSPQFLPPGASGGGGG